MQCSGRPAFRVLRIGLVCCLISLIGGGAHAQSPAAASYYTLTSQLHRELKACFDKYGVAIPGKLHDYTARLEVNNEVFPTDPQGMRLRLFYLTEAYAELGEWKKASDTLAEIETIKRQIPNRSSPYLDDWEFERTEGTDWQWAGIRAMQGDWRAAAGVYTGYLWLGAIHTSLPLTGLCLMWLALWRLAGGRRTTDRLRPQSVLPLLLLGLTPLFFTLLYAIVPLLNGLLVARNAGAFLINRHLYAVTFLMFQAEFAVFLVVSAIVMRKSRWFRAINDEEEAASNVEEPTITRRPWRRLAVVILATVLGTTIHEYLTWKYGLVTELAHLPQRWQSLLHSDGYWAYTLMILVVSSWAQELFFRGVIHRYACRAGGPGFGIVYGAIVFAGMHLDPGRFQELVFSGLVCAALYEVTQTLWAPSIAHSAHNVMVTIFYRG